MATLPTLTLCDDLAALLLANVPAQGASPNSVQRVYWTDTADAEDVALALLDGRRVTIAPSHPQTYTYEPHTRSGDLYTHHVSVLVEKRYTDNGDPPRAWIDAEVNWVYTNVVLGFDFDNRTTNGPSFNRQLTTVSADVKIFDLEDLLAHGKLFSSQIDILFNELVTA